MLVKTSDLTGPALDWAVAKAEGHDTLLIEGIWWVIYTIPTTNPDADEGRACKRLPNYTTWQEGGPIIEREKLDVVYQAGGRGDEWTCFANDIDDKLNSIEAGGPTPLVAAMRCYVASRLGDEVEVPDTLR